LAPVTGTRRQRLIVIGPVPPPVHGVTVSTRLVLANPLLRERFDVEHLDTSDRRSAENIGSWDFINVMLALKHLTKLVSRVRGEKGLVYLPLSQNTGGVLRDSLFIHVAVRAGWRVTAHLRGSEFRGFYLAQGRAFRWWIRRSLNSLDSLAVMGNSLTSLFDGIVPRERIAVVPNGTPAVERNELPPRSDRILFLSNLRRRKGVVEALDAALLIVREDQEAQFVFVGEWEDERLENLLRRRAEAANGRIRFLPAVFGGEKDRLLLSSSILLFPPVEPEGHPRVVLEAMSAGLPVVTTDRGAIAETVVDGESGFVLRDPVPEELAERLLRLIRDEPLRRRMGEAARRRYLAEFTQPKADRRLADWLEDVACSRAYPSSGADGS
jgi:glycosyltransferase involved in cell wall biosynthesis